LIAAGLAENDPFCYEAFDAQFLVALMLYTTRKSTILNEDE
jgi:hypothetical protein